MKSIMLVGITFTLFYMLALWIHDIDHVFGFNFITLFSLIYVIWSCYQIGEYKLWKEWK